MAHPAVGLAAPAHPELDDPAAGHAYPGDDPDGYLAVPEVVGLLDGLRRGVAAPVLTGTTVTSVRPARPGLPWCAPTGAAWHARTVVVATGATAVAGPPGRAAARRDHHRDRRGLPQPRPAPRRWRAGRGRLGERRPDRRGAAPLRAAGDAGRRRARADAAHLPGPRHPVVDGRVGPARRALGRDSGPGTGARTCRRCSWSARRADARPQRAAPARGARSSGGSRASGTGRRSSPARCANVCALADLKLGRLLDTLDAWADRAGVDAEPPQRFAPTELPGPAALSARLGPGGIETSSGPPASARTCPSSTPACSTARAGVVHDGGVTAAPGLYLMGLPFLRRRKSTLIDGAARGRPRPRRRTSSATWTRSPAGGRAERNRHGAPSRRRRRRRGSSPGATRSGCRRR